MFSDSFDHTRLDEDGLVIVLLLKLSNLRNVAFLWYFAATFQVGSRTTLAVCSDFFAFIIDFVFIIISFWFFLIFIALFFFVIFGRLSCSSLFLWGCCK